MASLHLHDNEMAHKKQTHQKMRLCKLSDIMCWLQTLEQDCFLKLANNFYQVKEHRKALQWKTEYVSIYKSIGQEEIIFFL